MMTVRVLSRMQIAQGSKQLIQPFVRALTTSSAASGSLALAAKPSVGSLFSFGTTRLDVPLSEPLPGVHQPLKGSIPSAPAKLESSVLSNGVKLASIATISPATTIALVLPGGSSLETSSTAGASKMIEAMAFQASKDRTTFRLTRELEKIGAVGYAQAGRDSITFAIDTVKLHTPEAVEILLDSVLNAKLQFHEFRDTAEIVKGLLAKAMSNPSAVLIDAVHRVAYDGPLGQPMLADPKHLSIETIREFYAAMLQPSNMLLAGIGADHAELKELVGPLFSAAHPSGAAAVPASEYIGGTANIISDSAVTHVALAFEAKGGLADAKATALAAVVKALLDEGRCSVPYSLDSGAFKSMSSFSHSYKDSGLIGIMGSSSPAQSSQLVDAVFKKLTAAAAGVSEQQLRLAKQVAVGEYKSSMSSSHSALPLITARLMASGKFDAAEMTANVEAITAAQIASFIKDMVKSAPTVVTYGALASLPRYDSMAKRLA